VVTLNMDTGQKRLELMHELLPAATTIGLLPQPDQRGREYGLGSEQMGCRFCALFFDAKLDVAAMDTT
jgi:hypothetical protein